MTPRTVTLSEADQELARLVHKAAGGDVPAFATVYDLTSQQCSAWRCAFCATAPRRRT